MKTYEYDKLYKEDGECKFGLVFRVDADSPKDAARIANSIAGYDHDVTFQNVDDGEVTHIIAGTLYMYDEFHARDFIEV